MMGILGHCTSPGGPFQPRWPIFEEGKTMGSLHFDFTEGARRADIERQLRERLGDERWAKLAERARAAGVPEGHHHGIAEVMATIDALDAAAVPDEVRADMRGVYRILAAAEAKVHGCAVEETHFHEVGEGARIRNTLLICLAMRACAAERITATPVQTGFGQVKCAHGLMDIPAPATAAILVMGIPVCADKREGELCTPTSAAIIKHFVDEFTQ